MVSLWYGAYRIMICIRTYRYILFILYAEQFVFLRRFIPSVLIITIFLAAEFEIAIRTIWIYAIYKYILVGLHFFSNLHTHTHTNIHIIIIQYTITRPLASCLTLWLSWLHVYIYMPICGCFILLLFVKIISIFTTSRTWNDDVGSFIFSRIVAVVAAVRHIEHILPSSQ